MWNPVTGCDKVSSGCAHCAAAIALRGGSEDFATYTYDTGPAAGRGDDDWYARDTVGLFLEPDTTDPAAVRAGGERIRRLLPEFLPATDRAVLLGALEGG